MKNQEKQHKYNLMRIAIVCGIDRDTLSKCRFENSEILNLIIQYITSIQTENHRLKQDTKRLSRALETAKQVPMFIVPVSKS